MLVFEERGKPEYPEKKTSRSKEENQQQMASIPGFGPHFWEESALTTVPPLLSVTPFPM